MKNIRKWLVTGASLLMCLMIFSGCSKPQAPKERYTATYLDLFDTVTQIIGYEESEDAWKAQSQFFYDELEVYHQLFDIYNDYAGVNNVKTINDNAGIAPVKVDKKLIDMLVFARKMYEMTDGEVNVAFGAVLSIWHDYREAGIADPETAKLPPMEDLQNAVQYTDFELVEIDEDACTVYLPDEHMSLDVGAIAKGYAVEKVCQAWEANGMKQAMASVGGNVKTIGDKGKDGVWKAGMQNPDLTSEQAYLHIVPLKTQETLVTSGDYQRYYYVGDTKYHHIIDPDTLMPATHFTAVAILCTDSGMGDALSTAVFNMPLEEGKALVESIDGVEAAWIFPDNSEVFTDGFRSVIE